MGITREKILELIKLLGRQVRQLADLDPQYKVWLSEEHKYKYGPKISMDELDALERKHQIKLPLSYKYILSELGDGGFGFMGILPPLKIPPSAKKPFLGECYEEEGTTYVKLPNDELTGCIVIDEYGYGVRSYLIVNGRYHGGLLIAQGAGIAIQDFSRETLAWVEGDLLQLIAERAGIELAKLQ